MSNNKKTQASYAKPSRADIVRSVVTSTAVETGQSSAKIEASLEATRKKFAHLRLAVYLLLNASLTQFFIGS